MSIDNGDVEYSINDLKVLRQNRDDDLMECVGAVLNAVTFGLLSAPILMGVNFERAAMVFALGKAPSQSSPSSSILSQPVFECFRQVSGQRFLTCRNSQQGQRFSLRWPPFAQLW